MCGGGGDMGAGDARAREEARQASIRAGMARIDDVFSQFNDDFYNTRKTAYADYVTPQLDQQHKDAMEALTFALARGPGVNSSVVAEKMADLDREYTRGKQAVQSTGQDYANSARSDVERNRADLVNQLNISADPTGAQNAAMTRSQTLSAMPSFSPLAQMFSSIAGTVGQYMEGARAKEAVDGVKLYQTGLRGSQRIVA